MWKKIVKDEGNFLKQKLNVEDIQIFSINFYTPFPV